MSQPLSAESSDPPTSEPAVRVHPGLEGVVASETRLSLVDGEAGQLVLAGYPLEEVAPNARFEEVVYLLWHGRLPARTELQELSASFKSLREVPEETLTLLRAAAEREVDAMEALRMGVSSLTASEGLSQRELSARLLSAFPTLVAAYQRLRAGLEPLEVRDDLGHAEHYLYLLEGRVPEQRRVRALDTYWNTVIDHGFNASTFAMRVIVSTGSDLVSATVGAIGALKGPLHGGAPGPALDMVFEIGKPERAEKVLREKLAAGERLMGFGHRVYKVRDPRAEVLASAARQFFEEDDELYRLTNHVEEVAVRVLREVKPDRRLDTNVEFYTALLLHGIGFETELFTPTFACGRVAGWLAQAFEQQREGKLIRPRALYVGERDLKWVPIQNRK